MPDEPSTETGPPPSRRPPVEPVDTGYTASGVPTFDSVREKIETRYGTAIGSAELAAETPEGRSVEEQYEARQRRPPNGWPQIRESMRYRPGRLSVVRFGGEDLGQVGVGTGAAQPGPGEVTHPVADLR